MAKTWRNFSIVSNEELDFLVDVVRYAPPGDIVIAGSFQGGDSMLLRKVFPERHQIVIDSFEGVATPTEQDDDTPHQLGDFNCGGLAQYLRNFSEADCQIPDEIYHQFITSENLKEIKPRPVAVLWLDLDHYQPTLDCINHFYGMVVKGGSLLTHDFSWENCPGIEKACADSGLKWGLEVGNVAVCRKGVL